MTRPVPIFFENRVFTDCSIEVSTDYFTYMHYKRCKFVYCKLVKLHTFYSVNKTIFENCEFVDCINTELLTEAIIKVEGLEI